jgi:hypothetical protein
MIWRSPARLGGVAPEHNPAPTPSRAVYGFILFLLSNFMLVMYLLWVLLPHSSLHSIGLNFFPQKYWAVTMPLYLSLAFFVLVVLVYPSLGRLHSPHPWDQYVHSPDIHTIYRKDLSEESEGGVPLVPGVPGVSSVPGVPAVYDMDPEQIQQYLNNGGN